MARSWVSTTLRVELHGPAGGDWLGGLLQGPFDRAVLRARPLISRQAAGWSRLRRSGCGKRVAVSGLGSPSNTPSRPCSTGRGVLPWHQLRRPHHRPPNTWAKALMPEGQREDRQGGAPSSLQTTSKARCRPGSDRPGDPAEIRIAFGGKGADFAIQRRKCVVAPPPAHLRRPGG